MDPLVVAALALVAGLAGWVDAIAGGGGLLQVPALLVARVPAPALFGVNKSSSVCGTTAAVLRYARHGSVRWDVVAVAGPIALAGSVAGTLGILAFVKVAAGALKPLFAALFLALAVQQARRALRRDDRTDLAATQRRGVGAAFVAGIGAYDGFVGPGTGMFLFWAFTTWWALPTLEATGTTKAVNWLTNVGSLATLLWHGHTVWVAAIAMGAANLFGGWLGSHQAIRRGVPFIRLLTAAVSALAAVWLVFQWAVLDRPT